MQKLRGYTVEDVQRKVAQNDKQRFAIQKEDGTGCLKIWANQGHTVEVEDLELTPITSADQVPVVLHGTYFDAWNSIKKQGLCRFKHNHIHFSTGEPGENGVISGDFPNPNAKPYDGNRERHMEASESLPRFETSKDNGVQGGQFSNDGTHQNFENTPRPPGSYPHEMRGNYRDRGRGQRNYDRDGSQQGHYYGDPKKVDSDQRHQQRVNPGPYQSDSLKDNRNQGHGQQAQSGPNQGDSQKGDMAQGNSMKSGMDQGYSQEAKTDSYQAHSQEGRGGVQDHGQGAEPISFQGHSQENINRGQHNENDSRQGLQAVFDQKDTQKGTEGDSAQGLEQGIEPDSYKGDVSKIQPVFDQNVSQKGKEGDHVQGAQPSCNKGNLKEGNDMGHSHGNDSIQRTQSASHQKDLQKSINYGQSHEKDSGQGNKFGPNQESWRKGENSSRGHYQDNSIHSYKGQKGSYSRQSSYGGGSRRDNFDQQQRKRKRADDEDDIFLSKTLSFLLRHGAEKQHFKLMPGGFLYVDEILKKMQKLEGYTVEDVQRIVAQNDKQRFAIQKEDGTGRLKIRANQGHTVEVEDLELTPITSANQVPVVLHGTYLDAWNSIKKQGLCRFKRNHIHFAAGEPGENGVISGMRSSCEVLIYIDLEKALKDGLKFYLSANRVILSPGNEEGYIYPCYFIAVLNRYPYHILEFDPNIKGKTVYAYQTSNELDKKMKKKNKKKKKHKDSENNESRAPVEEVEGVGDTDLFAGVEEKLKEENIEGKDEEDQFVDAMDTEPEKLMQIQVPDTWDDAEKVELDRKALTNSKGVKQSEDTQGFLESEDPKGTKESKTKEKDSWSEISEGASKSETQSRSQALKVATKPETPKRSIIPEGVQKAIKKGSFIPWDDEGAPNGETEDEEDVRIEEEWTTVSITNVEESQSAVEYILEHKHNEPVSIICCGEKQGDVDGKITLLVISIQNNSWIYQLCNMKEDLMEAGKLKQLFYDTVLMKVFHDVTWQSALLFKQYEIVLNGTKVFDSKVVCQMKLLDDKTIDILRLGGFMPSRWVKEDGKIDSSKWTKISLDQELINKLVQRCKALLLFYKMFTRLAESEDPKETKDTKTNEKDSWSKTSKGSSKSKAQSRSRAPKGATKPVTPIGSVIPEGEQKAIKKGPFVPGDDDEGAPNGETEDEEDVRIEEEWTVSITSVEESQSAVEYILEHKQNEPVSIICCGEKQGEADGKITLLVISIQNKSWIYQMCNMKQDLLDTGKLKQLFFDTDLMKVFHDVTWQSALLFKQCEIVLGGTKVFDSKVVCQMKLLDDKTIDILRLGGFMPSRWVEEDGKIDSSKWTKISLDQELINKLVQRCKALLQFYKMFTMQKVSQPKKEIYAEVNKYVDKKRSTEIKKNFKSQAEKTPPQPTSSSKEQTKGSASPKKKKKNKRK